MTKLEERYWELREALNGQKKIVTLGKVIFITIIFLVIWQCVLVGHLMIYKMPF